MFFQGTAFLGQGLHYFTQSLLIPVFILLLYYMIFILIELGVLISEYRQQRKTQLPDPVKIHRELHQLGGKLAIDPRKLIQSNWSHTCKSVITQLTEIYEEKPEVKRILVDRMLEEEEEKAERALARIDKAVKVGPMLGLLGTIIPLGPGLAALGQGDLSLLAESLMIAFDTTVAGLAVGGLAFAISKVKKRWYVRELRTLETVVQLILEGGDMHATPITGKMVAGGVR